MSTSPGYETDRVPTAKALLALAGTAAAIVACVLWSSASLRWAQDRIGAAPPVGPGSVAPRTIFEGPIHAERPGERARARASARLATYGWVSRERGIVRIPIERALDVALVSSELAPPEATKGGGP